jgi:hypothetical protein
MPRRKCAADCRKAQGKAQANDGADGMADRESFKLVGQK